MFIVQYQELQRIKWYDDPYFEEKETVEELRFHFNEKLRKLDTLNPNVRYKIVERTIRDVFIEHPRIMRIWTLKKEENTIKNWFIGDGLSRTDLNYYVVIIVIVLKQPK